MDSKELILKKEQKSWMKAVAAIPEFVWRD
jgi:hypothetical protein